MTYLNDQLLPRRALTTAPGAALQDYFRNITQDDLQALVPTHVGPAEEDPAFRIPMLGRNYEALQEQAKALRPKDDKHFDMLGDDSEVRGLGLGFGRLG